jgi:hypothetical protein
MVSDDPPIADNPYKHDVSRDDLLHAFRNPIPRLRP